MSDIKTYGSSEGTGYFWIQEYSQWGGGECSLIAVDEAGNVTRCPARRPLDEAAPTEAEAVLEHLGQVAVRAADGHLERRRRKLADQPPPEPKPEPMDEATRAFYEDAD